MFPRNCGATRPCSRIFLRGRASTARFQIPASRSAGLLPSPRSSRPRTRRSRAWWNSEAGQELRQIADRIQSVSPLLGEEIVFCVSVAGTNEPVPMVMARVQPGKRAELATALQRTVRRGGRDRVVFDFRRLDRRVRLAVAPGVGGRAPGSGRRLSVCGRHQRAVSARRGLADRDGRVPP